MPTAAYMTAKGITQSDITQGAGTQKSLGLQEQKAHEDEEMIIGFKHEVEVPTDPQSGQPTGDRVHKPIIVTTTYSKSTPLWYNALASKERLSNVTIKWYRAASGGGGGQEHYFTHILTNATVTNITAWMPNVLDPEKKSFTHMLDIALTYTKIEWKHEVAPTVGLDDWGQPPKPG